VNSIKIAESAKVIENIQRDVNIALVNELSVLFHKLNIPTNEVLKAAASKWNFHYYQPGLVGGHCIGIDPYYLAYKAEQHNYFPQLILSGRRFNENMGKYVATQTIKLLIQNNINPSKARIAILGFAFKQNIVDFRNTKVIQIVNELQK
jgi:UDP-N-acetyl-D-galactosamine dehydrogenase